MNDCLVGRSCVSAAPAGEPVLDALTVLWWVDVAVKSLLSSFRSGGGREDDIQSVEPEIRL